MEELDEGAGVAASAALGDDLLVELVDQRGDRHRHTEAVGFGEERGDSVVVINRSFETPPVFEAPPEPAMWEQTWFESMVKNTLAALLMGLLLLVVLRPAVRALTQRSARDAAAAHDGEGDDDDIGLLESDRVSIGGSSSEPLPPWSRTSWFSR